MVGETSAHGFATPIYSSDLRAPIMEIVVRYALGGKFSRVATAQTVGDLADSTSGPRLMGIDCLRD